MEKKCKTCEFFFENAFCRRFPPVKAAENIWDYPRVPSFSVCGEWTKKGTFFANETEVEDLR